MGWHILEPDVCECHRVQGTGCTITDQDITPPAPHIVVVLPAPLCPKKETTWFSWRFRLRLLRASLLPVLYTFVSLSIQTTKGRWLGSSSMPRISSAVPRRKGEVNNALKKVLLFSFTLILLLVLVLFSGHYSMCSHIGLSCFHLSRNLTFWEAVSFQSGAINHIYIYFELD